MKYLSNTYDHFNENITPNVDFEHFEEQDVEELKKSESNKDLIENIKNISNNYTDILLNADLTDGVLIESLYEYISLIQLVFIQNDFDFEKIVSNDRYFDKKPFNIYKRDSSLIWKAYTDFDFDNEDDKIKNIKYLVDKLTKDIKGEKDLDKIKKLLKNKISRKDLRKFLRQNRKAETDDIYDTLTIIYFLKITDNKFIKFLDNENLKEYVVVEEKPESEIETDKKSKDKIDGQGGVMDTVKKTSSNYYKKAKDYIKAYIPTIATNTAAVGVAISSKHKNHLNILHEDVRDRFKELIANIQAMGYKVVITSSYRDFKHQVRLKKQNKSNATPGKSPHNYGLALDLNIISPKGRWYKKATSKREWMKTGVPQMATKLGFRWGGNFKTYHDPVHFDVIDFKNYNTTKLLAKGMEQYGNIEDIKGNKINIS